MNSQQKNIETNINKKPWFFLQAPVSISLWQLATKPITLIGKNWQLFFMFGVPFAIILTIISLLLGNSITCGFDMGLNENSFCSDNANTFYIDTVLRIFLFIFFTIKWYQFALQKNEFNLKTIFSIKKSDIKAFGLLALLNIINISPIFVLFFLYMRTPNPNWKIELAYFTSVFWIFFLPIIAIRLYSCIAFAIENKKLPTLKTLLYVTQRNTLKLLLGISIFVFLALFIFMNYYAFVSSIDITSYLNVISVEFEYNILIILFMICFINYCYIQKEQLFKGDVNEEQN